MSIEPISRQEDRLTLAAKLAFLGRAESYPDPTVSVRAVESHMSWVFLTDRYAYKLKKPVRYPFLDFSTVEARKFHCEEEVRLNRRLAGEAYIGTVPLCLDHAGAMRLAGTGTPVDWLVKMHRLPAERMLDAAIASGTVEDSEVRTVARKLARFYGAAPPADMTADAYRARFEQDIRANLAELSRPVFNLPRDAVEGSCAAQLDLLERERSLFDERVAGGRVIEAHGDLRPEHICLGTQPVIIDCLEFNRDFRILDVADELSFFGLECDRLGAPQVGQTVFAVYAEMANDHPPAKLLDFYKSYRACMRAKLCMWHLLEPARSDGQKWLPLALDYLERAENCAARLA